MRHRQQQEREDRRAAMAAWVLANINRDTKQRSEPFSLEEVTAWLGYARQYAKPPAPQESERPSVETLKGKIGIVHLLHKGLYGEKGPQESNGAS